MSESALEVKHVWACWIGQEWIQVELQVFESVRLVKLLVVAQGGWRSVSIFRVLPCWCANPGARWRYELDAHAGMRL